MLQMGESVIIVGGGLFGLCAALAIIESDPRKRIMIFDGGETIPASGAASFDVSKSIRVDYGNDDLYYRLAQLAMSKWREFPSLFTETGITYLTENALEGDSEPNLYEKQSMKKSSDTSSFIERTGESFTIQGNLKYKPKLEAWHKSDAAFKHGFFNTTGGWADASGYIEHLYNKCSSAGIEFFIGSSNQVKDLLFEDNIVKGKRI